MDSPTDAASKGKASQPYHQADKFSHVSIDHAANALSAQNKPQRMRIPISDHSPNVESSTPPPSSSSILRSAISSPRSSISSATVVRRGAHKSSGKPSLSTPRISAQNSRSNLGRSPSYYSQEQENGAGPSTDGTYTGETDLEHNPHGLDLADHPAWNRLKDGSDDANAPGRLDYLPAVDNSKALGSSLAGTYDESSRMSEFTGLPADGNNSPPALPSPGLSAAQLVELQGQSAGAYDWANFVFAYSRGRWNPGLIPQPPGQSTLYPGISVKVNTIPLPWTPATQNLPTSHARRPSLEYVDLPKGDDALPEPKDPVIPEDLEATLNASQAAQIDQTEALNQAAQNLQIYAETTPWADPSRTGTAAPSTFFNTDVFSTLHPASNSMSAVTQVPNVTQDRVRSPEDPAEGHTPTRSQTVPDPMPSQQAHNLIPPRVSKLLSHLTPGSMDFKRSSSDGDTRPLGGQLATETSPHSMPADQKAIPPSTPDRIRGLQRPTLPQHISHLDLDPSPFSSPVASRDRPLNSSQATAASVELDSDIPIRPGPTPVQSSDMDGNHPSVWQSAPGGLSGFAEAMSRQTSNSVANQHGAYGIEQYADNNVVAGLRRAARRTSIDRAERPVKGEASRMVRLGSVSHSASFPGTSPRPSLSVAGPRDGFEPLSHLPSGRISISTQGAVLTGTPTVNVAHFIGGKPSGETRIDLRGTVSNSPAGGVVQSEVSPLTYFGAESQADEVQLAARASDRPRAALPSSSARRISTYLAEGRRIEQFYRENGYLPAILPPKENMRLHALARYGPPKLSGDPNFERIAHLVKLVFNSQLVLITLVGENEQVFQAQMGGGGVVTTAYLQELAGARNCSFCTHAILQDSDEPIVILDALKDWRFSGNPLVQGNPDIRFYAGSPLRTVDGHNIGSLCIIDNKPRTEFGPRLRHTLKEFARVVMREMELLRDRLQSGVRDRMQRSVEMFTKQCLEADTEADSDATTGSQGPTGTHKLFNLAAKSMREALQVSGAVIFDLSHFELIDSHRSDYVPEDISTGTSSKIYFANPQSTREANPAPAAPSVGSSQSRQNSSTGFDGTLGFEVNHSPFGSPKEDQSAKSKRVPPMSVLGSCELADIPAERNDAVPLSHHVQVAEFLRLNRTGKYYPFAPPPFRSMLPRGVTSLLLVPIFGVNKQPFALLCAYVSGDADSIGLEELQVSGLQYIRALGMIVLSATLKKDIMLADKAKSNFISNISHELRTPLHGILAAAELLNETKMNATQGSYLETVEACGKSLLELVNHVLDFTKLSGSTRQGRKSGQSKSQCDMVKLIQEVCESSWIGQMAKRLEGSHTGIGSVYAPPSGGTSSEGVVQARAKVVEENKVETVIDIAMRPDGWLVNCDIGGIRRVLMNLIGNSLKFTSEGFVHVSLREVQSSDTHIMVELAVTDTGLGISRAFLEEQLFHPFTQENPHGTGTGLGLSIVNSIVQSPSVNGKIDVWSTEGEGTEIRITCEMELCSESDFEGAVYKPALNVEQTYTVSFLGFSMSRGDQDLESALRGYFSVWWEFEFATKDGEYGDIVLINDDLKTLERLQLDLEGRLPPVVFLTASRGDIEVANACEEYHAAGGIARMLFKPAGPAKLESVVDFCIQCLERKEAGDPPGPEQTKPTTPLPSPGGASDYVEPDGDEDIDYFAPRDNRRPSIRAAIGTADLGSFTSAASVTPRAEGTSSREDYGSEGSMLSQRRPSHYMSPDPPEASDSLLRRHSTEARMQVAAEDQVPIPTSRLDRPLLPARSITYHEPRLHKHVLMSPSALRSPRNESESDSYFDRISANSMPDTPGSTISLEGGDGAVLKSAVSASSRGSITSDSSAQKKPLQILSVEDNPINRKVIAAYLNKMGIAFVEANNGQEGIYQFEAHPPNYFDVILMDLTMPVLDGISAIAAIRKIEASRRGNVPAKGSRPGKSAEKNHAKIFALTGRSTDEDKRKAFKTGADGYIVKPLSFRVLSSLLRMLKT